MFGNDTFVFVGKVVHSLVVAVVALLMNFHPTSLSAQAAGSSVEPLVGRLRDKELCKSSVTREE